jgi:Cu/Ag efflux protein CusF
MNHSLLAALPLAFTLVIAPVNAQQTQKNTTLKEAGAAELTRVTATVEAIDLKNRIVTLKGANGNVQAIQVGEEARNLPQLKVGDIVDIDYYESIAIDVKKADGKPALSQTSAGKRTELGDKPGGAVMRKVHIVTEVMGVNKESQSILVRGPLGNLTQVKVKDPKLIAELQTGGQVELTYLEGLAISVRPSGAK